MSRGSSLAAFLIAGVSSVSTGFAEDGAFVFRNTAQEAGLFPALAGIQGHGAGWGDVDGDGRLDLLVATFHYGETKPNVFFRNRDGKFEQDRQAALASSMRATGVVFADFDNDGDLDLYVASMPQPASKKPNTTVTRVISGCQLYENDGKGNFKNVSEGNEACPASFGGRSAAVLDYDGDGLLDLLVGEDPNPGYNGSKTKSSRLFRNAGELKFVDVSRQAGIPEGVPGLGVAAADVNDDGWPDVFLASSAGGNVLLLNDGQGKFVEPAGTREVFAWDGAVGDNMVCGVCFGDVNRDGLLDMVLGQHFKSPWTAPVANRLYLNRGLKDGVPKFEQITEAAGFVAMPLKSPHVEIQDYDNDGWPDVSCSLVKFHDGVPHPIIFRHVGLKDGLPQFVADGLAVNDYPTEADRAVKRSGDFFKKLLEDGKAIYSAPGPTGDYDNDGRLDMVMPSWWTEAGSLLLHNETPGGHWLDVRIEGADGVNRMGIGSRVRLYEAGKLGDAKALLGRQDMSVGFGYASGQAAIAHFGLGKVDLVDVEVTLPHGKGTLVRKNVKADQRVLIRRETE